MATSKTKRPLDMIGLTFSRLRVIGCGEPNARGAARWQCRCTCGNQTLVRGSDLRNGHTRSCGCLQREKSMEQVGPRNPRWRGGAAGYQTAHERVWMARGPAGGYACADACGRPATDWSYEGSAPDERVDELGRCFSLDPRRYSPRCRPCHRRHDKAA